MKKLVLACGLLLCSLFINLLAVAAQVIATVSLATTPVPHPVQRSLNALKNKGWKLLQVYKAGYSETAPPYNGDNSWLAIMIDPEQNQKAVIIYDDNNYFIYP